MSKRTTTYAIMDVPKEVYDLIKQKLLDVGYDHAILETNDGVVLSMNGIALGIEVKK